MRYKIDSDYIDSLEDALRKYDRCNKDVVFDYLMDIRSEAERLVDNVEEDINE